MIKAVSVKAQMASNKVAHRIALAKKTHTIAEQQLNLPPALDMVSIMLPLSIDTIA